MNAAANTPGTNRFLIDIFSFKRLAELQRTTSPAEFYQQIASELIKGIYAKQALTDLGNRLITLAENAYAVRQVNTIEQVSQMLLNLPLPRQYEKVGRYYYALSIKRRGRFAEARKILEQVAEDAPLRYRARATLTIGATYYESGDFSSALPFYIEANRAAAYDNWCDPLTSVQTERMIAVLKSIDGDHPSALADLRKLLPLARIIGVTYPYDLYNHVNSLAVELAEAHQLEEAQYYGRIILASPFADVYPEYRETWDDIALRRRRASRSVVSLAQPALKAENVFHLPAPDHSNSTGSEKSYRSPFHQQASVTVLKAWKEGKMVKEPNGDEKKDEAMDDRDVFMEIMRLSSQQGMSSKRLWEILEAVRRVTSKPDEG